MDRMHPARAQLRISVRPAALVVAAAILAAVPAVAQPFDTGPAGTVVGSSMSGARIGAGRAPLAPRIPGAEVFGDTVEERTYGRAFDDSYLTPEVRRGTSETPIELRATQGRSELNGVNAGAFARGQAQIGTSAVTRPSLEGRRIQAPAPQGRARIRR
jgi:hypothetical protein